ncbi:MAG: hypothetical protein KF729_04405 [Sandaracinaceae bacterium]|nr:hypothetical protein [Sandaracinaceae bacterium]
MLTNLLRPFLVARLGAGLAVVVLCVVGALVAVRVLRYWRIGASSEGQLALERRAELVAALVEVALVVAIANVALTVLSADRVTHSIRGAMCAWGVFDASPWGFVALGASAAAAAACALWVVLHRLDMSHRRPALTRRKFVALFGLAPIVLFDLFATTRWLLDLDMQVVASCCSTGLDDALGTHAGAGGGPRTLAAGLALAAAIVAALAALAAARVPGPSRAIAAAVASPIAAALALPAILGYVAPHAYETPQHLCPFCLLHADVLGLGWPLFGALFAATVLGAALGLVEAQRRASGEPERLAAFERRLGAWASGLWTLAIVLAAAPVVRWAVVSGGAPLFP